MTNKTYNIKGFVKHAHLDSLLLYRFDFFENATKETYNNLIKKLEKDKNVIFKLGKKLSNDKKDDGTKLLTKKQIQLRDEYTNLIVNFGSSSQNLNALAEMKVSFLFKSLEIVLKEIIAQSYPNINTGDFYKWENMKSFFKSIAIDITILEGYVECVETSKVNNCIKHNGLINNDVNKIIEFNGKTKLDYENLEMFYLRVKQKIIKFCENLIKLIIEDLYYFDENRISKIADEYITKMEFEEIALLILKLMEKSKGCE